MSSCIIRNSVLGIILLAVRSIGKTLFVSEGSGAPSWYTKGVPCGVFALVRYATIDENRLNRVAGNWHIWFDFRRYCCDPFGLKVGAREYVISLGVATMSSGTRLTKLAGSICSKPCVSYADVTDCVCKNDYISSRGMADILQRERRAWAPSLLMWAMRLLRSAHFRRPPMQRR